MSNGLPEYIPTADGEVYKLCFDGCCYKKEAEATDPIVAQSLAARLRKYERIEEERERFDRALALLADYNSNGASPSQIANFAVQVRSGTSVDETYLAQRLNGDPEQD